MGFLDKFKLGIWNIGVVDQDISDLMNNPNSFKIKWMKNPYCDRFFADPFLYAQDKDNYYILAEEYIFYEAKGKISLLTVTKKDMRLIKKQIIINEKHHLSFPYIYGEYIIPEGYRSGSTYAYQRCSNGLRKIKLLDIGLIDQTFLQHEGKYWIFAMTKDKPLSKLNIYYWDNNDRIFIPHSMNPVKDDIKTARPAGRFFEYNNKLYRPVQDSEKCYGHLVRFMEVVKLSTTEYEEKEITSFSSEKFPPYNEAFHTFNVYENCIIVDGFYERHSFFLKPIIIKMPNILKLFYNKCNHQGLKIEEIYLNDDLSNRSCFMEETC